MNQSEVLKSFAEKEGIRFTTVLIDEAAQCMESATLPAIVLGCEKLILVGDQNQLPPVVACPSALEHGLGVSLFARLASGMVIIFPPSPTLTIIISLLILFYVSFYLCLSILLPSSLTHSLTHSLFD